MVFKKEDRAIFIYGFAKNEMENISKSELACFKKLGKDLLNLSREQLNIALKNKALQEIGE